MREEKMRTRQRSGPGLLRSGLSIFQGIIIVFLFITAILFLNSIKPPRCVQDYAHIGYPYKFVEEPDYWSGIHQIVESNKIIYVLFESKCVVACYDLDGNYQYSFGFAERKKGQASIHCVGNDLYYKDRSQNYYKFENGEFVRFFNRNTDTDEIGDITEEIEQWINDANSDYVLHYASIWEVRDGVLIEEIVKRPMWLMVFQGANLWIIYMLCFLSLCILCTKRRSW